MSLFATYKQELRADYPNRFDGQEWRGTKFGLLRAVQNMTNSPVSIVSNDIKEKAYASRGRNFKIPVMNDIGDVVVQNKRSCTIGDLDNESALVDVSWVSLVTNLHMVKEQYRKNEISYLEDFGKKLFRIERTFGKKIEEAIYTKLDTEKSAVYNSRFAGTKFPLVGDTLQIASADQQYFFNYLDAIQQSDDFDTESHIVIGSTNLMPSVNHYINQGKSNDETLDYQYFGKDFTFSNRVVDANGVLATGFSMLPGTVGFLNRSYSDAESRNKTTDGTEWLPEKLNMLGLDCDVQYKSSCEDLSNVQGLDHLPATTVERWQIALDFCLLTPHNSDPTTKASSIKKFEFLT